ncbi:MAG: hypothetical protein ACK5NF_04075 [Bacilli bacterium]
MYIDSQPFERLKLYAINLKEIHGHNKNNMEKIRPCILIKSSEDNQYYNDTLFHAVPLTTGSNDTINNYLNHYTVDIKGKSKALIFNTVTVTDKDLKTWYNSDGRSERIDKKKYVEISRKLGEYMNDVVEKNINPLGYKSTQQRLEESNARLEESNVRLEEAYERLELRHNQEYAELKASNQKLVNLITRALGIDRSSLDL